MSTIVNVSPDAPTIIGFVVGGNSTLVLIRVVGPSLKLFKVENYLEDPMFSVYRNSNQIVENDDWTSGGNKNQRTEIESAQKMVGAFALDPESLDAATVLGLAAGNYTVIIKACDKNPDLPKTGKVLVEIYNLTK